MELAREHGVKRVACELDLDEYGLRRRMMATSEPELSVPEYPAFVDALISSIAEPAPASSQTSGHSGSAEIERSRGRPRIEWRASDAYRSDPVLNLG